MTVFSAAIDAIFADPNMAAEVLWLPLGVPPGQPVRAVTRSPDTIREFGAAQLSQPGMTMDVRVAEVPEMSAQDRFVINGAYYQVQGRPSRDSRRLIWSVDLREV
jgi:hypothetical protein